MKLVIDIESGRICRVVHWDIVDKVYIITPVNGFSGKWNDTLYDGVTSSGIRDLTNDELYNFTVWLLENRGK